MIIRIIEVSVSCINEDCKCTKEICVLILLIRSYIVEHI